MIYKFGVIRTVSSVHARLYVCGSIPHLGDWHPDGALALTPAKPDLIDEPSFWHGDVDIPDSVTQFRYKYLTKYTNGCIEWEGCGAHDDRAYVLGLVEDPGDAEKDLEEGVRYLKPEHWKETDGATNELRHTTSFYYHRVVDNGEGLHFSKIMDSLWLGSCPRQFFHVIALKSLGVDTALTLQTEPEIVANCSHVTTKRSEDDDSPIDRLENAYRQCGIALVWLPTSDMSTPARKRVLPEAVHILNGLLNNSRHVYIHCNAGVGRSAAIAAGYLMYIKKMPLYRMMHFLYAKRPAVYVDCKALLAAREDYYAKYGDARH